MSTFFNDIKYSFRQLQKSPGFTIVAALTLAIGISANITMFSVVNAVLLRPLPFKNADRLVVVQQHIKQHGVITNFSYPDFLDWRKHNQVFEDFAAYSPALYDMIEDQGTSKIEGAQVSGNFFSLLDVSAYLGRTFTRADEQQSNEPVAVVSHDLWRSRFAKVQDVLGRTITLHDKVYTIVGVLPQSFYYPDSIRDAQVWTVLNPSSDQRINRYSCWLSTIGNLKKGITIKRAVPLLNELRNRLVQNYGGIPDSEVLMYGLRDMVVRGVRTTLWVLSAIVGFILLIVCANVANLCLAKASTRDKEVAVRRALGANKLRLLRQFTTESVLLSLTGGVMGLFITIWTVAVFRVKIADFVPMADSIRVQPQELFFGLGLSLLVGMVLSVIPFWFIQRPRLVNVLTERRSTSGHRARFSNMLIAGQIAVALVLSIGMGLMIRSMVRLSSADAGFNQDNLVTFKVGVRGVNEQQRHQLSENLLGRLSALSYVTGVSTDSSMPCSPWGSNGPVEVDGYTSPVGTPVRAIYHNVSPDYFRTLKIPIRRGRGILPEEHQKKEKVVVINESLGQRFWPDKDPIDNELIFMGQKYRIVGIAADMIQGNVKADKPNHLFFPFDAIFQGSDLNIVVRTQADLGTIIEQVRAILKNIDATLPLNDISTFKAQMNKCISLERFTTAFLTIFASIALLLIVIGIYGVVSYAVAQRTREIGIRMALGAQKTGIQTMVLKQGLVLLAIGLAIGLAGAIGLTRFLSSYLYEVGTTDPVTFVLVPLLITTVSMLACFIPARRAAKVDPMEALRYE